MTPAGFSRKVQLTLSYIDRFLSHYQRIRQELREELEPLELNPESRVAIYGPILEDGNREFAELVYLGLKELGIEEVDVFAPDVPQGVRFLGIPVRDLKVLHPAEYDRVVVVFLNDTDVGSVELRHRGVPAEKLVTLFSARAF
jgi:hypothetical protein